MEITINRSKIDDFTIDDQGKVHAPRYFLEDKSLKDISKRLFCLIAKHAMYTESNIVSSVIFNSILDKEGIDFDAHTVKGIIELNDEGYISIGEI